MKRLFLLPVVAALVGLTGCGGSTVGSVPNSNGGTPSIQHVVILFQENRSFDNIFAGFPGADTTMQGTCLPKGQAKAWCKGDYIVPLKPVNLATGSGPNEGKDIDHSHHGFTLECDANASNVCQMDGFNLIAYGETGNGPPAKLFPYAYVNRAESAPYWKLAEQYTLGDRMFSTDTTGSFIAHQQVIAGTARWNAESSLTDEPNLTPWGCDAPGAHSGKGQITFTPLLYKSGKYQVLGPFPCFSQYNTLADLLDPANVTYNYYVDKSPNPHGDFSGAVWNAFDAIKKFRYSSDWQNHISSPNTNIFSDLKSGKLASVSWVIPTLYDSDHPASGCNGGPWWITKVVNAIGTSKYWKNTAIIVTWDEWGGWYDNVAPPQVNYTSLGVRVPLIIISPYAKPHYISHTQYDFGSILRYVEETFNLGSLGTTDAHANSLSDIFDFSQKPNQFTAAPLPHADSCKDKTTNPADMDEIIENAGGVPQ